MKAMTSLVLGLIATILFPTTAFAHTGFVSSVPANKEVVSEALKEIKLTFEGDLENLSTLTIVNEAEQKTQPANIDVRGNTLIATLGNELPDGDYRVNWKIAGEDGHVLEGNYLFAVAMSAKPESETVMLPLATGNLSTVVSKNIVEPASGEDSSSDANKLILLGLGVLILVTNMIVFARKRRNV